jgi:hypothetical protein
MTAITEVLLDSHSSSARALREVILETAIMVETVTVLCRHNIDCELGQSIDIDRGWLEGVPVEMTSGRHRKSLEKTV